MKKISLALSTLSSVCLLSCTDYKADIQGAHDSFLSRNYYDHSCACDFADMHYLSQFDGTFHYMTSGGGYIDYSIKCSSFAVSSLEADNLDNAFVLSYHFIVDGEQLYRISYELSSDVVQGKVSGSFSPVVNVLGKASQDLDKLQCPTIYFDKDPSVPEEEFSSDSFEEESSSSFLEEESSSSISLCEGRNADLWCGPDHDHRVNTGMDAGGDDSGYWWSFTDSTEGGGSSITWPVPLGDFLSVNPVIDAYDGLYGTFALVQDTLSYDPYVGLGFDIAGTGASTVADISSWGGLCIAYSSSHDIQVEIGLDAVVEQLVCLNDVPSIYLSADQDHYECYPWSAFEQAGWGLDKGGQPISGLAASQSARNIRFKVQDVDGTNGDFHIISLGRYFAD